MKIIILAAGMGSRLKPLTNDKPKCMVKLFNETLIERQIKIFHNCNIDDITTVSYTHLRAHETREDLVFRGGR